MTIYVKPFKFGARCTIKRATIGMYGLSEGIGTEKHGDGAE